MAWTKPIPLLGFAPDLPPNTLGAFTNSTAVVPTDVGFASGGYPTVLSTAMNSAVLAGAHVVNVISTAKLYAGTATKLYEHVIATATTTDRSGAAYTASASEPWSFAQFGNVTLAANKNDTLQAATTGNFAAVAGGPKASIIIVAGPPVAAYVMAFNYNDGTDKADQIWWSGTSDYTAWTPSTVTGSNKDVELLDTAGRITAAVAYRNGCVVFKRNSMYLGSWVGDPDWWKFDRISGSVGCTGKYALVEAEDRVYFADDYGFWQFDGSYPQPMPGALAQWWSQRVRNYTGTDRLNIRAWYDKRQHRVWFGSPNGPGGEMQWLSFNTRSQKWAFYGSFLNNSTGTIANVILSDEYALESGSGPKFQTVTWNAAAVPTASIVLGAHGDLANMTTMRSFRPLYTTSGQVYNETTPNWASASVVYSDQLRKIAGNVPGGVTPAGVTSGAMRADDGFDVMQTANYIAPILQVPTGSAFELFAYEADLVSGGEK